MGNRTGTAIAPSYAIGFIGGGNMANALIRGLIAAGIHEAPRIIASDVDAAKRAELRRKLRIAVTEDNAALVRASRVVVLAVKPQIMDQVLAEMRPAATRGQTFISIAAGISTERIERGLGGDARVVRAMPNTPALLGRAMSVVVRGSRASGADEKLAMKLLGAVGRVRALADEALIDAVTGLSGSGPAYVYRFAEAMIEGGVTAGLDRATATELSLQTIAGAAAMLFQAGETPARLREAVTSPGGTTQAGLEEMARRGFTNTVVQSIIRATERSKQLGAGGDGRGAGGK